MGKSKLLEILEKGKFRYRDFYEIDLVLSPACTKSSLVQVSVLLASRVPESERFSEELSHCSEKVISLLILLILLYSVFKAKNCSLIKIYRMNQIILEKIYNQIPPSNCEALSHGSQLKILK